MNANSIIHECWQAASSIRAETSRKALGSKVDRADTRATTTQRAETSKVDTKAMAIKREAMGRRAALTSIGLLEISTTVRMDLGVSVGFAKGSEFC